MERSGPSAHAASYFIAAIIDQGRFDRLMSRTGQLYSGIVSCLMMADICWNTFGLVECMRTWTLFI